MALINDRWRIPVQAPRPPREGRLCLLPGSVRLLQSRVARCDYLPFWQHVRDGAGRALRADLSSPTMYEGFRALGGKLLAMSAWAGGPRSHPAAARKAIRAAGSGAWGQWCASGDAIQNYLMAADILRAAGRLSGREFARFRDRLAPKLLEGHAVAADLPQNNWRLECDAAVAMAALLFWHDPGPLPVQDMLAAALDGIARVLFGLLRPDGANQEGVNYSRRGVIPVIRLAYAYLHAAGVDLLNRPELLRWHRWQVDMKRPDGRMFPFDDGGDGFEGYPHALLANRRYVDAPLQRWAHDRGPGVTNEWAAEAMLLFDHRVAPRKPDWPLCRVRTDSGTAIFRSGWGRDSIMLVLVARPLQPLGAEHLDLAHRHDDPTNFLLHAHGELLVTEGGYGLGYEDTSRHEYYLTGGAHNLILVDGEGPRRAGSWGPARSRGNLPQSAGRVSQILRSRHLYAVQAETGYRGVDFRRSVFFVRRRYFVIIDEASSMREHEYGWMLHGGSEDLCRVRGGARWLVGGARLTAVNLLPGGMPWHHGSARDTHQGARRGGREHAYRRCWTAGKDVTFCTVLIPEPAGADVPEVQLAGVDPIAVRVSLAGMTGDDLFIWTGRQEPRTVTIPGAGRTRLTAPATVVKVTDP